jgi:hypothetical protein
MAESCVGTGVCYSRVPFSGADGSGNGIDDSNDYIVWREHFGDSPAVPASGIGMLGAAAARSASNGPPPSSTLEAESGEQGSDWNDAQGVATSCTQQFVTKYAPASRQTMAVSGPVEG